MPPFRKMNTQQRPNALRNCRKCKKTKKINDFYKDKSRPLGHSFLCKNCERLRKRPGRPSPDWKKIGVTIEDYKKFFYNQNGRCAICGKVNDKKRLSFDHNHITMKIRGLLCVNCNLGLGCFKDNKKLLISAIKYLEE